MMFSLLNFTFHFLFLPFCLGSQWVSQATFSIPNEIYDHIYVTKSYGYGRYSKGEHDKIFLMYLPAENSKKLFEIITPADAVSIAKNYSKNLSASDRKKWAGKDGGHGIDSKAMFAAAIWSQYILPIWRNELTADDGLKSSIVMVSKSYSRNFTDYFKHLWAIERILEPARVRTSNSGPHNTIVKFLKDLGVDYKRCNAFVPNAKQLLEKGVKFPDNQIPSILRTAQHWGYNIDKIIEEKFSSSDAYKTFESGNTPPFLSVLSPMSPIDVHFTAFESDPQPRKYSDPSIVLNRSDWLEGKLHNSTSPSWDQKFDVRTKLRSNPKFQGAIKESPEIKINNTQKRKSHFDGNNSDEPKRRRVLEFSTSNHAGPIILNDSTSTFSRKFDSAYFSTHATAIFPSASLFSPVFEDPATDRITDLSLAVLKGCQDDPNFKEALQFILAEFVEGQREIKTS